jgi:uncharacterized protein DUF6815
MASCRRNDERAADLLQSTLLARILRECSRLSLRGFHVGATQRNCRVAEQERSVEGALSANPEFNESTQTMINDTRCRMAILYAGDREARQTAAPEKSRFLNVFQALADLGVYAEPAVYHDDFCDEVRQQLMQVDGVLVWVNPIEGGRDRSVLDAMLREVAATGVFVSAHPDIILKLGTKEVLHRTRDIGWGCDTHLYRSMDQLCRDLPVRLFAGEVRVLKQYRGNGGDGVWKVELAAGANIGLARGCATSSPAETPVRVRHAKRGCVEEKIPLNEFLARCEPYFAGDGRIIDQAYQPRLPEGMIRCYLVHDKVAGFGHQAINALCPAPPGAPPESAPRPSPRLYHPASMPEFQSLKLQLERDWVPAMQRLLDIDTNELPVLWDCDFLLGPKNKSGEDTYVLCEINVSSVSPFPDSAVSLVAEAALARTKRDKSRITTMKPLDQSHTDATARASS